MVPTIPKYEFREKRKENVRRIVLRRPPGDASSRPFVLRRRLTTTPCDAAPVPGSVKQGGQMMLRALTITGLIAASAQSAQAQPPSRPSFVIGGVAAGMLADYAHDNLLGLGLTAGIERELSSALTVRTLATIIRAGIGAADDNSICTPAPYDGCLPRALMPRWLSTIELTASAKVLPFLPLRLHAGIGAGVASDAREPWSGAPSTNASIEWPRVIRGGLELPLGPGSSAPRLVLSRVWLSPLPHALRRLDGLSLLFPR